MTTSKYDAMERGQYVTNRHSVFQLVEEHDGWWRLTRDAALDRSDCRRWDICDEHGGRL